MHRIGVIPFHVLDGHISVLLVTSQTRGRWVFPKGLVKKGESHVEACKREAFEEAGIKGQVLADFPITVVIEKKSSGRTTRVPVTFYPLCVVRQSDRFPEIAQRERWWLSIDEAAAALGRQDHVALLEQFSELSQFISKQAKAGRAFALPDLKSRCGKKRRKKK